MLKNLKASGFQSGAAAYFFHTVKTLLGYRPDPVDIEFTDADGEVQNLEVDLINLFICNGRCSGGGMKWAPSADLADGLFEVTLISGRRKLPLITNSGKVYAGRIADFPGAGLMQAGEVVVRFDSGIALEADGEVIATDPGEGKCEIRFGLKKQVFPLVI